MRAWSSRLQVEGGDGAVELFGGVGADDGAGHTGTLQEPGERDLGRRLADLGAQLFVLGQLPPEPVELPGRDARVVRPAGFLFGRDAAEDPAVQRAPGRQPEPVGLDGHSAA